MLDAIRNENPEADESRIREILAQCFELQRRLEQGQ